MSSTWAQPFTASLPSPDPRWWVPSADTKVTGRRSRAQLVTDALARVGNPSLTTLANGWLNDWLRKAYAAWPWPFLHVRKAGIQLPAGSTGIYVGLGGGTTDPIRRILDPIELYTSDRKVAGRARIQGWLEGGGNQHPDVADPATYRGLPTQVSALPAPFIGAFELVFTPFPDRDYLLSISYIAQPPALPVTAAGDNFVPLYPEEETMLLAVEEQALAYMNERDLAASVGQKLAARATNDRLAHGISGGINDSLPLDRGVFR